ncbi:MAG TPA: lipocalin family protein [Candidatus Alistipes intestinipullorum]|nr:lipocalin family protein [Candidatus Alistipes intestinipullorum]
MKKSISAAGCLLLLASCAGPVTYESLPGYWLESMPANPQIIQGVRLDADGSAASIGMHTLRYEQWERLDDRLILRGRSIGNGQTLTFADTLAIVRLDDDTLALEKAGMYRIDYTRADLTAPDGSQLLDSLRRPTPTSVLDIRRFGGVVSSAAGDVTCRVTLYTYENCGDGVFRLAMGSTPGVPEQLGRMYTLRGDASDENAVVYELRPFDGGTPCYFRFLGDRLEQLDATLNTAGANGAYTLTGEMNP